MSTETIRHETRGVVTSEFKGDSDGNFFLSVVKDGETIREIPVYSVRNPDHQEIIAKAAASGKPVGFQAPGVFGVMIAVENSNSNNTNGIRFWEWKRGRKSHEKVPFMLPPRDLPRIMDISLMHPDYHYLFDASEREKFWGLPMHLIGPAIKDLPVLNQETFVTTPEDSKNKPDDQIIPVPTVCAYFTPDPDWDRISRISSRYVHRTLYGITSFNGSGEEPPYVLSELGLYIPKKVSENYEEYLQLECIAIDEAAQMSNIRSSKTQVRLPLKFKTGGLEVDEGPELIITRKGPVSAQMIEKHTGHKVRVLNSAKTASRGHPEEMDLDDYVKDYKRNANHIMLEREHSNFLFLPHINPVDLEKAA